MAVGREMGKPPIFSSSLSSSPFLPNLSIILLSPTPFQLRNPLPYNSLPYLFSPDSVQFPSFPFLSSPPLWLLIKVLLLALSLLFYFVYFFIDQFSASLAVGGLFDPCCSLWFGFFFLVLSNANSRGSWLPCLLFWSKLLLALVLPIAFGWKIGGRRIIVPFLPLLWIVADLVCVP